MNQYILINHIKVQNANTIAGFTWGFPAITHFLGFTHNIERKYKCLKEFPEIRLSGCAVIVHEHQVHTYGKWVAEFTQNRNPAYSKDDVLKIENGKGVSVIEEGKMNMSVSLLISFQGNIGNRKDEFISWFEKVCLTQRLAGGTIINEKIAIDIFSDDISNLRLIKRKLLPGFVLMDRSAYLQEHYEALCQTNSESELLDAWMDFVALKKKARPKSDLISKHFLASVKEKPEDVQLLELQSVWQEHMLLTYTRESIPPILIKYFSELEQSKDNRHLIQQWQDYMFPNEETDAIWEYIPKPKSGYLVPIMTGYKAISPEYKPGEVKNTRDKKTPVCFVEAVHSVGEWKSVHRIKNFDELNECLWHYHHEKHWYLCKQLSNSQEEAKHIPTDSKSEYNFY